MNKKIIAIALISLTILIGAAAIYVGMKLSEGPTTPPVSEALTYNGIRYQYYCPGGSVREENGTVCLYVPSYANSFFSKHWCDTTTWLAAGCNCPSSATCDQSHIMADGSVNQQGMYSPATASCECSDGAQTSNLPLCSNAKTNANISCGINLYRQAPYVTKICLDRVPGDRAQTYCGLQQIDLQSGNCYLSGLMSGTAECTAQPTITPTYSPTISITVPGTTTPYTNTPTLSPSVPYTPTKTLTPTLTPSITYTPTTTPSVTVTVPKTTIPVTTLPPTAIITDEVDRMIIGVLFLFVGLALYKSGLYISLGNVFWNRGGSSVWGGISDSGSAFDKSLGTTWIGLNHLDNKVETGIKLFFEKIRILLQLVSDNLVIIGLKIANIILAIALLVVRFVKMIGRFAQTIGRKVLAMFSFLTRIRVKPVIIEKKKSFEEKIIESSSKKRN